MKSATHIILAALVLLTASLLISAQTAETSQNPRAQNSQSQAPPVQAPPAQNPAPPDQPSQKQPPQTSPAAQPPASQTPPPPNPGAQTTPPQSPPSENAPTQPSQPQTPPAVTPPPAPYTSKFPGDPARSESEAQALGYARVVLRAQQLYKKRHDKYAPSLADLAGTGSFTRRMAKTTERGDYTVGFRSRKDGFILVMTPKQMDEQHRSFYAEEDAVIHADDQKPADANSPRIK